MYLNNRIHFIDYLKVFLSCTVIIHHAGQPYGGSGGFWYVMDTGVNSNLGPFFSINAAFNMSFYFLISAYFIPLAFEKKGQIGYLKDRLQRIGVPLLFGFIFIIPFIMYFFYNHFRPYPDLSFFEYIKMIYLGYGEMPSDWSGPSWPDLNFGYLWFIEHLLIYSLVYILFRILFKRIHMAQISFNITHNLILMFIVIVSVVTFFVRTFSPIDAWTGAFGFIQIEYAHFPQYFAFVLLGIAAASNNWIQKIPEKVGKTWLMISLILIIINFMDLIPRSPGGLDGESVFYAFYETMLCTGLIIGLIEYFHRKYNKKSKLVELLSKNTFCVYIIHTPVLIVLQYALLNVSISGYAKFAFVSVFGIILSHLVSYFIIRKIPIISLLLSGTTSARAHKSSVTIRKTYLDPNRSR